MYTLNTCSHTQQGISLKDGVLELLALSGTFFSFCLQVATPPNTRSTSSGPLHHINMCGKYVSAEYNSLKVVKSF